MAEKNNEKGEEKRRERYGKRKGGETTGKGKQVKERRKRDVARKDKNSVYVLTQRKL